MSIEQQGPQVMRNADGEELFPVTRKDGSTAFMTDKQRTAAIEEGTVTVPHSGETVVREFDTPLADAPFTVTPDTLADTSQLPQDLQVSRRPEQRTTQKLKTWQKLGVAAAGAGAVVGAAFGVGKAMGGNDEPVRPETSTSASATPGETSESPSATPEETSYSFSAEKYTNNPELLMADFIETFNEWQHTGYSKEAANAAERFTMSDEEYAAQLNQASDEKVAEDILVSDWQNIPGVVDWYETSVRVHNTGTAMALKTEPGVNREDIEQYQRFIDLNKSSVDVVSNTPDTLVLSADWTGRDNRDKNRAAELITDFDPNSEVGSYTLTFTKVDGEFRLSNVQ